MKKAALRALAPRLDAFLAAYPHETRIGFDPVEFPHRYRDPRDIEVVALLAAALAYGRADLFKPKVAALLAQMGDSPARYLAELTIPEARRLLEGFVYRFNLATDVAVLLFGVQRALREHGSLEALYLRGLGNGPHAALAAFVAALRDVPLAPLRKALGPERGLHHLLPSPLGPGAAKRLNLYLRWMVRGPDAVDFGIWSRVSPASLVIPLDTHIGRISSHLGLTKRKDLSFKTALEITDALRQLDPADPVKYDFALCHYGMSGLCPVTPRAEICAECLLLGSCGPGGRRLKRARPTSR